MKSISGASLVFLLHASLCVPSLFSESHIQAVLKDSIPPASAAIWQTTKAEHVYGLPDIKNNKKGTLTLTADTLSFTGKDGNISIPRSTVTAVSAGNQRVEIWGMGGRILRMTIPNGGGLAAATVMHHRIDMLTVEFNDPRGGSHAAVFFLPANEADHALQSLALAADATPKAASVACQNAAIDAKSVLVSEPNWDNAAVPAAYRALVYEHLINRLRTLKDVGHVYRDGETEGPAGCPQYTVKISIATFKEGSSVKRSFMGRWACLLAPPR